MLVKVRLIVMKSKLVKILICGLLITLSILSIFTNSLYNKNKQQLKIQQNLNNQVKQEQTFKVIDKSIIVDKLNSINSLNVLEGIVEVNANYSDKNVSDQDVSFRWIKQTFNHMNSKSISIDNTYKFTFSYDIKNIPINIQNNTVNIRLTPNNLSLTQCELAETKSIKDDVGLLTSKFSPQELASISSRTRDLAYNRILSDGEMRTKAMEELQGNIKDFIKPLLSKSANIHFNISDYDVIQDDTVSIIKEE